MHCTVRIHLLTEMTDLNQVMITVPHVVQRFRWDCGLACSQMVLRFVLSPALSFCPTYYLVLLDHNICSILLLLVFLPAR